MTLNEFLGNDFAHLRSTLNLGRRRTKKFGMMVLALVVVLALALVLVLEATR